VLRGSSGRALRSDTEEASLIACNCGGKKSGSGSTVPLARIVYTLTEPNGHRRSYATQAEANSAQSRLGGTISTSR
jgi:hypothetical protein